MTIGVKNERNVSGMREEGAKEIEIRLG